MPCSSYPFQPSLRCHLFTRAHLFLHLILYSFVNLWFHFSCLVAAPHSDSFSRSDAGGVWHASCNPVEPLLKTRRPLRFPRVRNSERKHHTYYHLPLRFFTSFLPFLNHFYSHIVLLSSATLTVTRHQLRLDASTLTLAVSCLVALETVACRVSFTCCSFVRS